MTHHQDLRINVAIVETTLRGWGNHTRVYWNEGLRFEVYKKWQWFFDYRVAVFKIENPRKFYELKEHRYFVKHDYKEEIQDLKNRISGAKSSITKKTRLLRQYEEEYEQKCKSELFAPPHSPLYSKAKEKIKELKDKLWNLELEYLEAECNMNIELILTKKIEINE